MLGLPDFEELYEPWLGGDDAFMTPRMACWLWQSALASADLWRFIADRDWIEDALPVVAHPYAHGRWLHHYVLSFDRLADRIAGGDGESDRILRCTAEELALHEIIDRAEGFVLDGVIDFDCAAMLPDHGDEDRDFGLMRDVLFPDRNVLLLFDPALDGIEAWDAPGTENLHPRDWFTPFR